METAEKYLAIRNLIHKTESRALVYGVTISEYLTLKEVVEAGSEGISRMDLAESLGLSVLELTKALQPLEKLCFIETMDATPNPRERRIAMTSGGSEIFGDIEHEFLRRMNLLTFEIAQLAKTIS
jgi:DNA-binding MarR family transcriptional regulator